MRPNYNNVLNFSKIIRLFFYTSSIEKLLQARLVFGRYGYSVRHFRSRTDPYNEDYSLGTDGLLRRAISQIKDEFDVRASFFVEDTSLRIESLSGGSDYPGVAVKDWFTEVNFDEVDVQIKARGGDRSATIKSDIALSVPTLSEPILLHAETTGIIGETAPRFAQSPQYPWLTPNTFNGWFVPTGAQKRLGEMEFEESLEFDFRAKAFLKLIGRLDELNAALNLPSQYYVSRKRAIQPTSQLALMAPRSNTLLVIGHRCAGKSTLGDYLLREANARVFEASSVLRSESLARRESVSTSAQAIAFLHKHGMDVVARRIADAATAGDDKLLIVTGLRTVEEVLFLTKALSAVVVWIDADSRVRYERHIRRARAGDVITFRGFSEGDEEQNSFGVLRIAKEIADFVIHNEGTIEEYQHKVDEVVGHVKKGVWTPRDPVSHANQSELYRCLKALSILRKAASCNEIAKQTGKFGQAVRKYNTNRALKSVPEFAQRVRKSGALLSYRILPSGQSALDLMDIKRRHLTTK
jgi:inosine/xanthosine triphosphate pyrophosphatase family protein/dephospho-CoA kinase